MRRYDIDIWHVLNESIKQNATDIDKKYWKMSSHTHNVGHIVFTHPTHTELLNTYQHFILIWYAILWLVVMDVWWMVEWYVFETL